MVKIEVTDQEARAIQELMKDAKCPIPMGFVLGGFMNKILRAFNLKQEEALKEKFKEKKVKDKEE